MLHYSQMAEPFLAKLRAQLPATPGIQGRHRYFNSAVLIPFIRRGGEYHLLFQVRASQIRQGGEICFPGGRFEPDLDRNYRDTALRETEEELGLPRGEIELLGNLDTLVVPMGTAIEPCLGVLPAGALERLDPDPGEVARVFTLPISYFIENDPEVYSVRVEVHPSKLEHDGREVELLPAKELGLPERYHTSWGGNEVPIYVYRTEEGVIWGMTAELVIDLSERLRGVAGTGLR